MVTNGGAMGSKGALQALLKNKKVLIGAGVILLIVVGGIVRRSASGSYLPVGKIQKGPIVEAVYGIGTVTPEKSYQLKVGVTGTIQQVHVREGDLVKRGAPLLTFDGTLFRAPFEGTVTSFPYKIAETVFPQIPILSLVDLKQRYLVVTLEQQGALRVRRGQPARISFESLRDKKLTGKVRTIFSNDANFIVHIEPDELPDNILPGMTADVAVEISRKESVLVAPVTAINQGKIWIQRGRSTREVAIVVGTTDGEFAEIKPASSADDLADGDIAVVKKK